MQEYARPPLVDIAPGAALTDAVAQHARSFPDDVLFSREVAGRWVPVTTKEFATEVAALAAGLVASGVQAGDRVGLLSRTRYEWTLCDYAIWTAGAVTVPVYETSSAEQVHWNLCDSGAVAVVVEAATHRTVLDGVRDRLPELRSVWQIDAGGLAELAAAGRDVPGAALAERRATLTADSLATIVYTSGTTGRPRGCELTHRNLLTQTRTSMALLPELFGPPNSTLLFLPLAHVFARFVQVACVEGRVRVGHTADVSRLVADLAAFRPTFILAVPRVFEKIYNGARQQAGPDRKGRIFDRAATVAVAWSKAADRGRVGPLLALQHRLFDRLVYRRLRAALGGRIAYAVSGGAPLGERLGHFFRGIGVTVLEGYGLTETAAPSTCNTPDALRIGTVGRPLPGTAVRVTDDGEVLLRGDHLFRGYWHDEAATREVLADGWFATGDLGALHDGFLRITGRRKELIVTATGKNVAPTLLEDRLRAHPLVSQCMVVGDGRPYIGCLVTLDADAVGPWLTTRGLPRDTPLGELVDDADLIAAVQSGIDDANAAVSHAEAIKKFRVLPNDWTEEGGQLTPSLKLRRSVVMAQLGAEVEALYRK